ncbi:MAG: hypothetical protein HPY78_03325 [Brevinematales bacterium]|nr:hypothetical protein [Brevinematales bacterium]
MNKLNFYSGQNVIPADMNMLQNFVENKDLELTQKLLGYGVVDGFDVIPNSPADLSVIVAPGFGVDTYGRTLKMLSQKALQLNSYVPSSNSRYVSVCAKFTRKEYDTRLNDIGEEIKYRLDEDVEIVVVPGEVSSSPSKPIIESDSVLLADVLLSSGQSQITSSHIDVSRRQNLISLLAHETNVNNPHKVKLSQLGDYVLSGDLNANSKKITNLPAPSSNTEPVRKQDILNMSPIAQTVTFNVVCYNGDGDLANISFTLDVRSIVFCIVTTRVSLNPAATSWMTPSVGFKVNGTSVSMGQAILHTASVYYASLTNHWIGVYDPGSYTFTAYCDSPESQTVVCLGRFSLFTIPVVVGRLL